MNRPKRYLLTSDAVSMKEVKGKSKVYAKKGTMVTEISDCDTCCVVEGPDGNRFPVSKSILKTVN